MQILKEYVSLIKQFRPKSNEIAAIIGEPETLFNRFYYLIASGKCNSDEAAAEALYKAGADHPPYKSLKTELKKRLINTVLALDFRPSEMTDWQQAYYLCQKNWAAINVLMGRLKMKAAIDLAQTTLETAKQFEQTEMIVNLCGFLAGAYRIHKPLSKLADEYDRAYEEAEKILEAENRAKRYYDELSKHFIKSRAMQSHLKPRADVCVAELGAAIEQYDSYKLHLYGRMVEVISHFCINDYAAALNVVEAALSYFEAKPFEMKNQLVIFLHQKTTCCVQLKMFEQGKESALKSFKLVMPGSLSWFKDRLVFVQLCLHTKQYRDGWETLISLSSHPDLNSANAIVKDEIRITEVYLNFIISLGKIKLERSDKKHTKTFNYLDVVHSVPTFQKDKRGMNIPSLIAQVMWLLKEKQHDLISSRIEAIEKYRTRHIGRESDAFRTNTFILLIRQLEKAQYRKSRIPKKAARLLIDLKSVPMQVGRQPYAIEVLPYEDIWDLMMEVM